MTYADIRADDNHLEGAPSSSADFAFSTLSGGSSMLSQDFSVAQDEGPMVIFGVEYIPKIPKTVVIEKTRRRRRSSFSDSRHGDDRKHHNESKGSSSSRKLGGLFTKTGAALTSTGRKFFRMVRRQSI